MIGTKKSPVYESILKKRKLKTATTPFWTMDLKDEEIQEIKQTLISAYKNNELYKFSKEAALYYAYWWQNIYEGGSPSSEKVTTSIGLTSEATTDFYNSAKNALRQLRIPCITSKGRKYNFRTLLSQGGLPIYFIQNNIDNSGNYKLFLSGLIKELAHINIDWNDTDFIQNLTCFKHLPVSFRNESIYDLSLQIVHAIIENRTDLLPYDNNLTSLQDLTNSLKQEHELIKQNRNRKPFSFSWELSIDKNRGRLFYTLECGQNINSDSISNLNVSECYQFDVYVDQTFVATYKRVQIDEDQSLNYIGGFYRVINIYRKTIEWNKETYIEVKIICDNGEELFLSVCNCYPPNFEYPQIFQKTNNSYILRRNRNQKENVIISSEKWCTSEIKNDSFFLADVPLKIFTCFNNASLYNPEISENWNFKNDYNPCNVELSNIYVGWIEFSNYKLLPSSPIIKVYDEDNNIVQNVHSSYRTKGSSEWHKLTKHTSLAAGLIEIKVESHNTIDWIETFFSISGLSFDTSEASENRAIIKWNCPWGNVKACLQEGLIFSTTEKNKWTVLSESNGIKVPAICSFNIFKDNNTHSINLSIANPFKGLVLIDGHDTIINKSEIISFDNLQNYKIVQHGLPDTKITFSYRANIKDEENNNKYIKISILVKEGITTLSNYEEVMERLFNLYGFNSFDRFSSVSMKLSDKTYLIRKFVYDSKSSSENTMILCSDNQDCKIEYKGNIWAYPIDNDSDNMPESIVLEQINSQTFKFPSTDKTCSYIVFSDKYDIKRIVPKFYQINPISDTDALYEEKKSSENLERAQSQSENIEEWKSKLEKENVNNDIHWKKVVSAFQVATRFRLPFGTFNQLKASVSTPNLFAKFLLTMYLNSDKEDFLNHLQRFELEFAIGVHWIKSINISYALDDLKTYPTFMQNNLIESFTQFFKDLLETTLDEACANACSKFIVNGKKLNINKKLTISQTNEFCARAYGHDDNGADMPSIKIRLSKRYYNMVGRRLYHYTMLNAPIRVFEYMGELNDKSLWNEDILLRRVINFYRKYYMRTYCDILDLMLL